MSLSAVPLHEKDLLTVKEAAALGFPCPRVLQQLVREGVIKRAVVPMGLGGGKVRRYRLIRSVLLEELQARGG